MERLFIPPILNGQYRFFQHNSKDIGFLTWAQLSRQVTEFILKHGADPRDYEWNSGPFLWIIDMVADQHFAKKMALDIQDKIFTPDFVSNQKIDSNVKARALRRNPDKTIRKVATFNFKK